MPGFSASGNWYPVTWSSMPCPLSWGSRITAGMRAGARGASARCVLWADLSLQRAVVVRVGDGEAHGPAAVRGIQVGRTGVVQVVGGGGEVRVGAVVLLVV